MEKVKEVMTALGVLPKLRLGKKLKGGGVKSHGPKLVKFLSEPEGVTRKDFSGKPQKMLRFEVEHEGVRFHWYVRVLNAEGQGNYLMEELMNVKVGDERVLEMTKQGARNYIDVRDVDSEPTIAEEDEGEEIVEPD